MKKVTETKNQVKSSMSSAPRFLCRSICAIAAVAGGAMKRNMVGVAFSPASARVFERKAKTATKTSSQKRIPTLRDTLARLSFSTSAPSAPRMKNSVVAMK